MMETAMGWIERVRTWTRRRLLVSLAGRIRQVRLLPAVGGYAVLFHDEMHSALLPPEDVERLTDLLVEARAYRQLEAAEKERA